MDVYVVRWSAQWGDDSGIDSIKSTRKLALKRKRQLEKLEGYYDDDCFVKIERVAVDGKEAIGDKFRT